MKRILHSTAAVQIGQSLVELALSLPLLIILLAGTVEVSNLLVTQSRVQSAARAASGHGATTVPKDAWTQNADWATAMAIVSQNAVTGTLDLSSNKWDMWAIKATVNEAGDGFSQWIAEHPLGDYDVYSEAEWTASEAATQAELLTALAEEGLDPSNLEFVATVNYYSADMVLGLPVLENFTSPKALRGLSVMRVDRPTRPKKAQCVALPIALYFVNYSLWWEDYDGTSPWAPHYATDPVNLYDDDGWDYGFMQPSNTMPAYTISARNGFRLNDPGRTVNDANQVADRYRPVGYIFRAKESENTNIGDNFEGNFAWLSWDGDTSTGALVASLMYPGNLSTIPPDQGGPGAGMINYIDPHLPDDHLPEYQQDALPWTPELGDWVQGAAGNMNATGVRSLLQYYIDNEVAVIMPLFDQVEAQGSNFNFRIAAWAEVIIRAYKTTGSDKRILIEYVGPARDCAGDTKD